MNYQEMHEELRDIVERLERLTDAAGEQAADQEQEEFESKYLNEG